MEFESGRVDIPCPACGKPFRVSFGQLAGDAVLPCTHCQTPLDRAAADVPTVLAQAREAFNDLQRAMAGMSKPKR